MSNHTSYVSATVAAGVLGGVYCAYRAYQESQKSKLPDQWKEVGTLKKIWAYPIKSCGGIVFNKAECTYTGLKSGWIRDRALMFVDDKDNFITARVYPKLLHVKPSFKGSVMTLAYEDMDPISFDLAQVIASQSPKTATVWSVPVAVYDCGWEVSEWISRLLDCTTTKHFRLVYYYSQSCRKLKNNSKHIFNFKKTDTGALQDEISFHLINEASIEDLNTRVATCNVTVNNFRPNFLLKGPGPYEEDDWRFVKIGENIFEIVKPCFRCLLTTIDPETGIRDPETEPLKTLRSYRQSSDPAVRRAEGSSPRLGLQMALRSGPGGLVAFDDKIYVA